MLDVGFRPATHPVDLHPDGVSILVVLDVGFRHPSDAVYTISAGHVSILVVLDVGFRPQVWLEEAGRCPRVSILGMLDVGL